MNFIRNFISHIPRQDSKQIISTIHILQKVLSGTCSVRKQAFEKSWNTSVRIMFDIPLNTHCYYVEALSETKHVQTHTVWEISRIYKPN